MLSNRPIALVTLALLAACAPPWAVIRQSGPPSALAGAQQVSVATDFNSLMMGGLPVAQYIASHAPEEQAAFQEVLRATDEGFRAELANRLMVPTVAAMAPPQPGEVRVTARFVFMEQGKYAFIYKQPSELTTRLVWSVGGVEVDEIETYVRVTAEINRPAIIQRLRIAATITARHAASFFARAQEG